MKKNFLYSMILMLATMFVTSCEDDSTEGLTFITYYPTLTLEGESFVVAEKGTAYQDPGYSATLQGEDVTDQVEVTSNVNMNQSGLYSVTGAAQIDRARPMRYSLRSSSSASVHLSFLAIHVFMRIPLSSKPFCMVFFSVKELLLYFEL